MLHFSFGRLFRLTTTRAAKHIPRAARPANGYSGTAISGAKFAVIVPLPPMVAVVEDDFEFWKTIEDELESHEAKVNPIFVVAESGLIVKPSSYQSVAEGDVEPAKDGETRKVTCH